MKNKLIGGLSRETLTTALRAITEDLNTLANGSAIERHKAAVAEIQAFMDNQVETAPDWSDVLLELEVVREAHTTRDSAERLKNMDAGKVLREAIDKLKALRASQHQGTPAEFAFPSMLNLNWSASDVIRSITDQGPLYRKPPVSHGDTAALRRVYDVIGLNYSHPVSVLLENFKNIKRFSDYLSAVEREFFMVPGEPIDEPEDEGLEPDDVCLVNKWPAESVEHYVEQFRAALPTALVNSVSDAPTPSTGEKWSLSGKNGSWDYGSLAELIKDNYGHGRDSAGPMGCDDDVVVGSTVYRAIECKADPAVFLPDASQITETMFDNAASSDAGEWVDNYPDLDDAAKASLEGSLLPLKHWARTHCQPDFFTVKDITSYTITADDVGLKTAEMKEFNQ